MELEQLRQLKAIADRGTVSAAAAALHLSQPALSRSMQKLERDLGVDLFARTANRMELNDAGRLVLRHAEDLLRGEQRLRDAVADYARASRSFRVGTCAPAPLWRFTERVLAAEPGVLLSTEMVPESDLVRLLLAGSLDAVLLTRPAHVPGLQSAPFMTENLFVSLPADHSLASRAVVSFADLDGQPFLLFSGIGFWRPMVERAMPNTQFIMQDDYVVFGALLRDSSYLAFATDHAGAVAPPPGRVIVPISDADAHVTFYLATRASTGGRWEALVKRLRDS